MNISRIFPRHAALFSLFASLALMTGCQSAGELPPALASDIDKGVIVARTVSGTWVLREDAETPGRNCAVTFMPHQQGAARLTFMGPSQALPSSAILFDGPQIPGVSAPTPATVQLLPSQGAPQTLKAMQLPPTPGSSRGLIAVPAGDIRQTMGSIRESEKNLRLSLNHVTVFSIDYENATAARNAMSACLAGKRFNGQSLEKAMAEVRPVGKSTITGQAYAKIAALARKQYPPKGSRAIGLFLMTPEFMAWFDTVKRSGQMPDHLPKEILRNFMTAEILDDKGHFRIGHLPAGEYTMVASFSYNKPVRRREVAGYTDVYVDNQYVGSNTEYSDWIEQMKTGTSVEKRVVIAKDGDTVDVRLDDSKIFCVSCM